MKNKLFSLLFVTMFLSACTLGQHYKIYKNHPNVGYDAMDISFYDFEETYSTRTSDYGIRFKIDFLSKVSKAKSVWLSDIKAVRESNKAEYILNTSNAGLLALQRDITSTISFSGTIPSSSLDEKYRITMKLDNDRLTIYLYSN